MRAKRAAAVKKIHNAIIYLYGYGSRDIAVNVARDLLANAETRVLNGFRAVPPQNIELLLAIEREYRGHNEI